MAQTGLGIFFAGDSLSLAAIKKSIRQSSLVKLETYKLSGRDIFAEDVFDEIVRYLQKFTRENKLRPAYASVGLSRKDFLWNLVDMPPVEHHDLKQLMQYELELHVPLKPEDIYFDSVSLNPDSASSSKTLLLIVQRNLMEQFHKITKEAGLNIDIVEPVSLACLRMNTTMTSNSQAPVVCLSMLSNDPELLIVKNGVPMVSRVITGSDPWGRNTHPLTGDTDTSVEAPVNTIWSEIQLALLSAGPSASSANPPAVFFVGKVSESFKSAFLNLAQGSQITELSEYDGMTDLSAMEITAISLARGYNSESKWNINLLPDELRPVRRQTGLMVTGSLTGFFLSALIIFLVNVFWNTELSLMATKYKISQLDGQVSSILEANKKFDSVEEDFQFFKLKGWDYPSELEILAELTRLAPAADSETEKKVWLEDLQRKEDLITITGMSDSPENLVTLMEESMFFEKVHIEGKVKGQQFTIKANISKLQPQFDSLPDEETPTPENPSEPKATVEPESTQESTPLPEAASDKMERSNGQQRKQRSNDSNQPIERGPAFPRSRDQSGIPSDNNIDDSSTQEHQPPNAADPGNPPETSQSKNPEEMERMKNNLFEFIQKHREEGNVVDRDRHTEVDPDEAASNFLEFLKTAAEKRTDPPQE